MKVSIEKWKKLLIEPGLVEPGDFENAAQEAKEKKEDLTKILVEKGLIKDHQLGQLVSEEIHFPFVNLRNEKIDEQTLKIIPELVAKNQQIIAFDRSEDGIKVAMNNPRDLAMIRLIGKRSGEEVLVFYATSSDINLALGLYKKEMGKGYEQGLIEQAKAASGGKAEDESVIKMVDSLMEYGYENKASDIHIEPYEEDTVIRFRIDGIMHKVVTLPKSVHDIMVTRIKVLAKLRTDEHMAAQDGKFQYKTEKGKIDVRVSIAPITEGEKVVTRILSSQARQFSLEDLGFGKNDLKKVQATIRKPWGMILATGPTGSGKTTTLYSILKILNTVKVNIATIEDPVEYDIEGINQIQVNERKKITFSAGLRTIVRQDPDIIMVGEIRDQETANIAINSAMTGHLVLSTLHTNDAATTLPRLIDMGVEPFLVASTINTIIAQRLVRKICTKCQATHFIKAKDLKGKLPDEYIEKLSKGKEDIHSYHGAGCKTCAGTGYTGRVGIYEILEMDDEVKELIMNRANADKIRREAIKNGMTTMLEDGLAKISIGVTTIDEVLRVIKEK